MSVMLNDERTDPKRRQIHYRDDAISGSHDRIPDRRRAIQMVKEEEAFVAKCALALALLGITPLILFLIIHYFQLWFGSPV